MFEKDLQAKFEKIFGLKATFNAHGDLADMHSDSKEQEKIFIEIQQSKPTIKDGKATARIQGIGSVFCQNEKLPYGYFAKRIAKASSADTQHLFFYDFENHDPVYLNLCKRYFSFIYLYSNQYDPSLGVINQLEVEGL